MKKTIQSLFLFAGVIVAFSSCEKKLDLFPYSSIEVSQSFKSMKDALAYNNGILGGVKGKLYGIYTYSQDVQGDQLNATLDFGNRNGNPHRWGTSFLADDYTIRDTWSGYYFTLKNVNAAIEGYPNITAATPVETDSLNRYKGTAFLSRAFIYSELILRFAKPYEPATANTDLGVPLVLTYNPAAQPARATVKQVYDQILSDIAQAKTFLASFPGAKGSSRFTLHAAKALEARVRLYMQDWAGAKQMAEEVIASGTYPLYNTAAGLLSMWKDDAVNETIIQAVTIKPNELANANSIYLGFIPATSKFAPDFVPSQWVVDKYDNLDIRKNVYYSQKPVYIQGADYPNIWVVNKYPGNPALFTGATTNYQHAPKMFRVAELYLISAEAGAKLGGASEPAALSRLNDLRVARGLPIVVAAGAALMNEIRDERFRELAFEGFRLWDLKRWHLGFTRSAPQNLNMINVGPNYNTLSIPADDNKFVWAIPVNDMTTNPSLAGAQNPGW